MPTIQLDNNVNVSAQVGDMLYESVYISAAGFNLGDDPVLVGLITAVNGNSITVTGNPTSGAFFMFLKDNTVNSSSVVGEYAEVILKNNSKEQAELFTLGSEIAVSSK